STTGPLRVRWINLKRLFDDYMSKKFGQSVETIRRKRGYKRHIQTRSEMDQAVFRLSQEMRRIGTSVLATKRAQLIVNGDQRESRISPFQLLLDEDVIIEEQNGVVYFVYEAFMEYIIAKSILANIRDKTRVRRHLLSMIQGSERFVNMRGSVLMALIML